MTVTSTEEFTGYDVALEGAVYLVQPDAGYVRIEGADRVDYLHRQTTNDVNLLEPGRAVLTVLTSPTARIYDALLLVDEGEAIGAITVPGRGADTAAYFQSRIFFNDKIAVTDASAEWAQFVLEGPDAGAALRALGLAEPPELDGVAAFEAGGVAVRAIGRKGLAGMGYLLLAPAGAREAVENALGEAGVTPLSAQAHEALRVEAGLPGEGELTEDYTPLEVNLGRAVSDTKGCYTGQEVIARQITYDKVTKGLAGLRLEGPAPIGANVSAEGRPVGTVTSAVESPRYGAIALAVVKRPHDEAGTPVTVGDGEVGGEVTALPFGG